MRLIAPRKYKIASHGNTTWTEYNKNTANQKNFAQKKNRGKEITAG